MYVLSQFNNLLVDLRHSLTMTNILVLQNKILNRADTIQFQRDTK